LDFFFVIGELAGHLIDCEVDALVNGVPGDEDDSRIVTIDDYELYDL